MSSIPSSTFPHPPTVVSYHEATTQQSDAGRFVLLGVLGLVFAFGALYSVGICIGDPRVRRSIERFFLFFVTQHQQGEPSSFRAAHHIEGGQANPREDISPPSYEELFPSGAPPRDAATAFPPADPFPSRPLAIDATPSTSGGSAREVFVQVLRRPQLPSLSIGGAVSIGGDVPMDPQHSTRPTSEGETQTEEAPI